MMPGWCHFYGQPPREFWLLTRGEYNRMTEYANDYARRMSEHGR
jgi:hypothetical protein